MSSFSTTPQYIEVIVGFIDNKIKQVEDKLFIKPKEDEEEKVIIEQLLFAEYKGSARIINPKLSEQESVKLHQELDVLESFKTISPEEAFNNIMQQQKSIIEVLQKEYSLLSEKSNTQHKLASSNELKLKTLKSEYNKKMNQIYDDDAKGKNSKDHLNNTYAAHGIIYMIIAGISLAFAGSDINTFTMFRILGLVAFAALVGVVIWNFVTLNSTPDFTLGDPKNEEKKDENYKIEYYQQLRDEVKKELSKSGNLEDVTEANITTKMQERIDSLNKSSNEVIKPINNILLTFAIVISILIVLLLYLLDAALIHQPYCAREALPQRSFVF